MASRTAGQLQVILGPMFSGKSTELLRRIRRFTVANKRCLVIKYKKDTRYSIDSLSTHDQQMSEAKACSRLSEAMGIVDNYDVIGIDEGQFFPDVVDFSEAMSNKGKTVIVAALDGTFQRKPFVAPFGPVLELIPLAEHVTKLTAVCMLCFKDAAFSKRIGTETEVEVIGGAEKYISVCRPCYTQSLNTSPIKPTNKPVLAASPRSPISVASPSGLCEPAMSTP
eukprot:TRINITY_DN2374_c0_g1_i1.p1 TRINITY_DN2374_c0_g1~~TRINITY_DN2374_c0_g1_i1.p1  ORF type:complete len:224 (-),score=61.91 TRINITY_DN2374_c0_g1_i1:86-757(-)